MRVKRIVKFNIKKSHIDYKYIKNQLIESKEIYNFANYILRQLYFKNSKYHLNKIDELISKWEVKSKEYISEIDASRPNNLNDFKNYVTKLLIANDGIMTDDIQKNINNYSEELITKALYKLKKGNKEFLESKDQHFKGIEKYKKYKNKDSYACVNMIQTIDKRKLTPVSEFESAGNITISEESMNLIENRIRKIYFNI